MLGSITTFFNPNMLQGLWEDYNMKFANRIFINYEKVDLLQNVRYVFIYVIITGKPQTTKSVSLTNPQF